MTHLFALVTLTAGAPPEADRFFETRGHLFLDRRNVVVRANEKRSDGKQRRERAENDRNAFQPLHSRGKTGC